MEAMFGALNLQDLGAGAVVILAVLLIFTGRLVPRRVLQDMQADRDHWRQAANDWQKAALEAGISLDRLIQQGEVTNHALTEIQEVLTRPELP